MPAPKRKVSKRNLRTRRAQDKLEIPGNIRNCPQCGEPAQMHRVCKSCGYYKGKEVIEIPLE